MKGFLNYSKKNKPEIKNDDVYESTDFPINRFLDEAKKMLEDKLKISDDLDSIEDGHVLRKGTLSQETSCKIE